MKKGNQQTKKTMRMMTSVLAALMLSLRDSFLQQEVVTSQLSVRLELTQPVNVRGDAVVPGDGARLGGRAGPGGVRGGQAGARVGEGLQQHLVGRAGPGVLGQCRAG